MTKSDNGVLKVLLEQWCAEGKSAMLCRNLARAKPKVCSSNIVLAEKNELMKAYSLRKQKRASAPCSSKFKGCLSNIEEPQYFALLEAYSRIKKMLLEQAQNVA